MKQALVVAKEIRRMRVAIEKTKSQHLKNDYSKSIRRLTAELREYCGYRNLNFDKVMRGAN